MILAHLIINRKILIWRSGDRASWYILIIKPTRCTNFPNLFLGLNSTCFGQFLCPSSGVFHCTYSKPVWPTPLLCVQWKTPDDGQRNCPKHVEFNPINKFGKLVHLVGFIIRMRFILCIFKTIYNLKMKLPINKNLGNTCTTLTS